MEYTSNSPQETFTLGKRLGEQAKPGEVYCLDGDLGVGKTIFTQGFAAGLGIDVPGWFFVLFSRQSYPARLP